MINVYRIIPAFLILASAEPHFVQSFEHSNRGIEDIALKPTQEADQTLTVGDGIAAYSLQNYQKAYDIWMKLAENGDAESQYRLGYLYHLGLGVEQSNPSALKWLEMAADQNHIEAQFLSGTIHAGGIGVPMDTALAYEFYLMAAENGHGRAQYQVGMMMVLGELGERDFIMACVWFSLAQENLDSTDEKQTAKQSYDAIFNQLNAEDQLEVFRIIAKENPTQFDDVE